MYYNKFNSIELKTKGEMYKMKAAIYHGIENVTVEELPIPECGERDVVLKIMKGSICGTDISAYYHGGDDLGIFPEHTFGHEMSAIVYKKGSLVPDNIYEGMRVVPNAPLSKPADCGLSIFEICDECGAFSQYVLIEQAKLDYNVFALPDNVDFEEGALVEPLAVAVHGLNKVHAKAGEKVLIFGAGMIGLCTVAACLAKGIKDIVVADVNDWRLSVAEKMGAIPFNSAKGDLKAFLMEKFGDKITTQAGQTAVDIDCYVDTAGAQPVLPSVLNMCKDFSRLSIVAIYHHDVTINPAQIFGAELEIVGSFAYTCSDISEAIEALHNKTAPVKEIITDRFKLDDINEAFAKATDQNSVLKIIIDHDA